MGFSIGNTCVTKGGMSVQIVSQCIAYLLQIENVVSATTQPKTSALKRLKSRRYMAYNSLIHK